jgi:hypothetical protein
MNEAGGYQWLLSVGVTCYLLMSQAGWLLEVSCHFAIISRCFMILNNLRNQSACSCWRGLPTW